MESLDTASQAFQPPNGAPEVARAEVGIPHGHLEIRVPQDLLHLLEGGASHHHVAGRGVAQVVEAEALDAGVLERLLERGPHLPPGAAVPPLEHEPHPLVGIRLEGG